MITEFCNAGEFRRFVSRAASGGGVTTEFSAFGAIREISAAGVSGGAEISSRGFFTSDHATMLGRARSRFSLIFGGVTIVCESLSASGGTEIIGWGEKAGSAFCGGAFDALRVSTGGRYSDGW